MKKDSAILFVAIGSALFLGGALTWSYYKSQPTNIPPPPPPIVSLLATPVQATGNLEDLYV